MAPRKRTLPQEVSQLADAAWQKWSGRIAAAEDEAADDPTAILAPRARRIDPLDNVSGEARMIAKIRKRMKQYPEWYEHDPQKVAARAASELERIGQKLVRDLPETSRAIEIWDIPLSVFNWIYEDETGEHFVRGALTAWAHAEDFNAANKVGDPAERARLRASFLDIAPALLRAVLEQLEKSDLVLTLGEKYVGPRLEYMTLWARRPHRPAPLPPDV